MPLTRSTRSLLMLLFPLGLLAAPVSATETIDLSNLPPINRHPVLLYDVTGGSLLGPIHFQLNVFSDGYSSLSAIPGPFSREEPRAEWAWVGADEASALRAELRAAGAHRIVVPGSICSDTPITSVTVFRQDRPRRRAGRHRAHLHGPRSHSYTFGCLIGEHSEAVLEVRTIIFDFIGRHFPD